MSISTGGGSVDGRQPGPDRLAMARLRWGAVEDRLYPQLMADPDTYQRVVSAVGSVLGELRSRAGTLDELLAVEAQPADVLAAVDRSAVAGIGDELVLQAACSVRSRELAAAAGTETASG